MFGKTHLQEVIQDIPRIIKTVDKTSWMSYPVWFDTNQIFCKLLSHKEILISIVAFYTKWAYISFP